MSNFIDVAYPKTLKISSNGEMIPLEFFGEVIPLAKKIQFKLGYFSSNSISTLSYGFAQFIFNGGSIDFLINHFVTEGDYKLINNFFEIDDNFYNRIQDNILSDIERLNDVLTKKQVSHFYNCLRYLIDQNRINIIPVTTKNGEISHYKEALFWDYEDNILNIVGSCNFTYKGIVCNGESFLINRSWGEEAEKANINQELKEYELIFSKKSTDFIYLKPEKLINIIKEKSVSLDIKQLLEEEVQLVDVFGETYSHEEKRIVEVNNRLKETFSDNINKQLNLPIFPGNAKPREYQERAYKKWCENGNQGIFAMATGTGKTITALNVLREEYLKTGKYKCIILVPTQILVFQWLDECKKFQFRKVFTSYDNDWVNKLQDIKLQARLGINTDYIFITTYSNYNSKKFQTTVSKIKDNDLILIADEAHNLGTARSISNYLFNIYKRIGLTATPNRKYDERGTSEIEKYFNSFSPKYTFNYSMMKAITDGFLTKYYYYPKFVTLSENEMEKYAEYTEKLLKYYDFENGTFRDEATNLLIQRKRVVHQAENKKKILVKIINSFKKEELKHTIVYVPEGFEPDYSEKDTFLVEEEDIRIIDDYNLTISNLGIKTHQIIGGMSIEERKNVLKYFEDGKIQVLTAMKTLDEGVDIPATKCAIFCASTGNPRQFIQRRGRILRNFKGKEFATVFDLIIEPNDSSYWNFLPKDKREKIQRMEINIFRSELDRVANFLYASENRADLFLNANGDLIKLVDLSERYNIDIFGLINELIELDKTE